MDVAAYQRRSELVKDDVPSTLQAEFDRAYRAYHPAVRRHLLYLTGDTPLSEDLMQETFTRLYERGLPGGAVAIDNPRAWLLTVASNLAYNHFRGESRRSVRETAQAPLAHALSPDLDQALDVRAALATLDARDRVVLMLRASDFSYAEIAEAVGLAPTSVGTILARSQRRFREIYESASRADPKE
jgi:RNA polymerase sigma factor (sigma-70 family)